MIKFRMYFIFISTILLSGCIGFLTSLKVDTEILSHKAHETVLVVEEDYSYKEYFVPKGTYYPNSQSTDGYVNYLSPQKIKVVPLFGKGVYCSGGITVNSKNPYEDYKLFKYYDCGDPYGTYDIPKEIKFRILRKNS